MEVLKHQHLFAPSVSIGSLPIYLRHENVIIIFIIVIDFQGLHREGVGRSIEI